MGKRKKQGAAGMPEAVETRAEEFRLGVGTDVELLEPALRQRLDALAVPAWDPAPVLLEALRDVTAASVTGWVTEHLSGHKTKSDAAKLDLSLTPYMREPLDNWGNPAVREQTFVFARQLGKTTIQRCCVGYSADQDPGPALFNMPTEALSKEFCYERLKPLFEEVEALARHVPHEKNLTKTKLELDRMDLHMGWSGSLTQMMSRPRRLLFNDEVDRMTDFSIETAKECQHTFWDRKRMNASTPTTTDGPIWIRYQQSDQRQYHVPCPHCGCYQVLEFDQIRWPKAETTDAVEQSRWVAAEQNAVYVCAHCEEDIEDWQKPWMLMQGLWLPAGQRCETRVMMSTHPEPVKALELVIDGEAPRSVHRGYHLNRLYSPWATFSDIAAKFLQVKDYVEQLRSFVNTWLARPWEAQTAVLDEGRLAELRGSYSRGTVPSEATVLTAGVDVQLDHVYWVVRAWSDNFESWLVDWGIIRQSEVTEALVRDVAFGREFQALEQSVVTAYFPRTDGELMPLKKVFVDSRYRRSEVLAFCRRHYPLTQPIQGRRQEAMAPWREFSAEKDVRGRKKKGGLHYVQLDVNHYKDRMAILVDEATPGWHVPQEVDGMYVAQFFSQHKVVEKTRQDGRVVETWKLRPGKRADHLFDCETYGLAAADRIGVGRVPFDAAAQPRAYGRFGKGGGRRR